MNLILFSENGQQKEKGQARKMDSYIAKLVKFITYSHFRNGHCKR